MNKIIKNKVLQILCVGALLGFSACGSSSDDSVPPLSASLIQGHVMGTLKLTWTPQNNVPSVPILNGKLSNDLNDIENIVVVPINFNFKDANLTKMQIIGWPGDQNILLSSSSIEINAKGIEQETDCKTQKPQAPKNLVYSCVNALDMNPAHDIKPLILDTMGSYDVVYITKTYDPLLGIIKVKKIKTLYTIGAYYYADQKWAGIDE